MALITVGLGGTETINTSETDAVAFLGLGTLNVTGTPTAPITVNLTQLAGVVGALDTVNITNATVTLSGLAGVSALTAFNIGSNGRLNLASLLSVQAASTINFTGPNSVLGLNAGLGLGVLTGVSGFAPGSAIDVGQTAGSITYTDAGGTNTGGVLTIRDAAGFPIDTVPLTTGEYTAGSFTLTPDGNGGTYVSFAPTVTVVTASPANADLGVGGTATLVLTPSVPLTIAGGTPTLALSDGGTATYDSAASTPTTLVFTTTVTAGQNTPDLAVTGVSLNGATVTDGFGAAANLSGAVANPAGTLQVDTTPPAVTGITATPANADLGLGGTATVTVTTSEPVTVAGGTPTLALNDGGTATYNPAVSTPTSLTFTYVAAPGQNTPDLAVTGVALNGATVTDAAGNAADLSGAAANPAGTLQVDTTAPTVTGVSTSPASGTLGLGQTVAITVTPSEPITVTGGTPTLALSDGGTATYNPAASTPTTLVFTTTVGAGQSTSDLAVTGVSANGATIADAAGNAADLSGAVTNPAGVLAVDGTPAVVTGVTATPANGDLGLGATATITVATSKPVTVAGGTPTLALSDGGTATYNPTASTPTTLVFTTTIAAGQNTPDLAVTGTSLNGATVTDAAGNALSLATAAVNPAGILQVDTTVATVAGVTATPANGDLGLGTTATITVATTKPVAVAGGTPTLALNDGGTATYNPAASTPTSLVFTTTVAAGQSTPDLAVTGISLNGATVTDAAGNAANLAGAAANPAGTLQVDTTVATVAGVTATPANGDLGLGTTATITVATTKPVAVTGGTPTLALNDGGIATYSPTASTPTILVFTTTVAAGQSTPDLAVTGIALNGATVADAAGNAADLSGVAVNPAGTLQVDTTAPTVSGVTATPANGDLGFGTTATITVATTKPVTVAGGTPTLALSDGGTATYDPTASTPTSLAFTTTVAAGQATPDLAVTGVSANGATITDVAGNAADLSGAVTNPPGVLAVDGTVPTVTGVTATPASGDLGLGATATITVATSKPVAVTGGTPTLALSDGGTATYNPAASTPTTLVFTTTVGAGQNTPDLAVTGTSLNGATIADALGNALPLGAAVTNPAGTLQVDTTVATVAGVTATPANGDLGLGTTATITVATTKPVTVAGGTPTLALSDGGTATYNPTASTPTTLVFTTTVGAGQSTPDLAVTGVALNGATVTDAAGNAADLSGAAANPAGTLQVDTTAPTVTGVSTSPASGTLGTGQVVTVTITPSKPVTVAGGTPTLALSDGGTATYNPAASTPTTLVFTTTVGAGQATPDLAVTGVALNGATVTDAAGNAANLAGAVTNPPGVLAVDGTVPTVTGVTATPANGDLGIGATATITVATSKPVAVTGGTPTLALSDGGTATYNPAVSTPTSLVFTTTVTAGQSTSDLAVTGTSLNGATVADALGNALPLGAAIANPAGTLQVDGIVPVVSGVSASPGSGTVGAGQAVTITLTPSKPVTVTGGTPTLALNDGGTATYNPGASTPTGLVFTTIPSAGQNAASLGITGVTLNGATVADAAGNGANLSGAVASLGLGVDTTPPTVTGVTLSPSGGTVMTGQPVTVTVGTSEPVTVTGGPPAVTLSNGGTAAYNPAGSTSTSLGFTYTPAAGDDTSGLAVTGVALNGGTITDASGNALNLEAAETAPGSGPTITTAFHPFLPVAASSADPAATVTVTVATRPFVAGTYSNLGTGSIGADGATYTVTGTTAQVDASLAGVLLTPARGSATITGYTGSVADTSAAQSGLTVGGTLANVLAPLTVGDAVTAGSGNDTLLGGTGSTLLVGGTGADVLVGSTGGGTLLGGTGSSTFFSEGGATTIVGRGAADVIAAAAGNVTVVSAAGGRSVIGLGTGTALVNGQGTDTLIGGSGAVVGGIAAGSVAVLGSGAATISAAAGSTVVGGAGTDVVGVRGTGVTFFAGSGPALFIGGTGASTVVGGAGGRSTILAGAGGGILNGGTGGNNYIVGGQGTTTGGTTVFGGGTGDLLFAQGGAGTVIRAGSGAETVQGVGSSGNDTFFLGSGPNLVGLGTGRDAVFAGTGNATVVAGAGRDVFAFARGAAGGAESIIGFKAGTDVVSLQGYDAGEVGRAVAGAVVTPGTPATAVSTTVTLSDNTRITFQGLGALPATLFG